MAGTAKRVLKNTGFLYMKMGITMFISLWTTRLILNSLGASDFGIFGVVGGAISLLGFLNSTMASATQRFMNYAEGEGNFLKQKEIFNISLVIHFVVACIFGIILFVAAYIFFNGVLNIPADRMFAAKIVYGSMVLSTMFTVMSVPYDATINAHENMKYYAVIGIFESFLKLAVAFATVYTLKDRLVVYGILMACIPFITLTILRFYCHRHYKECSIHLRKYWNRNVYKEMISFAGWNFLGSMSSMVGNYSLGLVLNMFFGPILNAAQAIATRINGMLMLFSSNMLKALNPLIAKSEGGGERQRMLQVSAIGNKYSFFLLAIFAIPVIIEMPYILQIWLKKVPEWAVVFARLQLFYTLILQTTAVFHTSIAAQGDIASYNKTVFFLDFVPVIMVYILFKHGFSPISMYVVNILVFGMGKALLKVYYMKRNCKMPYSFFLTTVLWPVLIVSSFSFAAAVLPHLFMNSGFLRLCMVTLVSTLAFFIALWRFGTTSEERMVIETQTKRIVQVVRTHKQ